jgi:hypothetical protein
MREGVKVLLREIDLLPGGKVFRGSARVDDLGRGRCCGMGYFRG